MSLRDRCKDFFQSQTQNAIMRLGDPVQNIHDFVLSEIGRAPELADAKPLVLYFQTEADRDELVAAIMAEKPNMLARKWP
jgi:hypothetical protein